jgi:hypothetical protein
LHSRVLIISLKSLIKNFWGFFNFSSGRSVVVFAFYTLAAPISSFVDGKVVVVVVVVAVVVVAGLVVVVAVVVVAGLVVVVVVQGDYGDVCRCLL